ncbi:SlyX family protein [Pasteurellaceae bacterium 20609_3]|uniref:SlyX family protein n=1 Tax=Spirabiliibacterium mucosae TaxID=28156 RepID=UPI001AADCD6B|nr:SlyX family protein [Spirabiliibacterium mucosae]MBE2898798.1 SlyX family protein [Spirabiliibacterium mucosae]
MMNNHDLLNRIAELETKITFQEGLIDDLNQALITQQFALDKLQQQVRLLAQKITDLQPSNIASMSEETPPPHY